ncbi:helix-turn-helix domain-containing protein [Pseudodesulfovibrio sp. JC047]|uniref:ATP-binding protein n=1 Tax=Pseudodesulfovibrio sp. JC047 TaxID=2683199 RepID=UPI0013D76BD5|nr:ATP-binding protein [Pseudodesulfovibrio sp. JC047]NDV18900.1 helix-turn-helix domain-containing protein [Pseudodesulfovibrio sp. JC047]
MSILFGNYIRGRRESLRKDNPEYSIRRVAKRIGIHHSYLSKVERGEPASFSERTVKALAKELEEDPDLLMAMNGKISEEIRRAIFDVPELFPCFVRHIKSSPRPDAGQCELAVLRSLRDMSVVQMDSSMRIVWAKTDGTCSRCMEGRKCYEFLYDSGEPCAGCPTLEALQKGEYAGGEIRLPNGDVRLVGSTPLGRGAQVTGAINFAVDVSSGKKREHVRREAEAMMLHDIRSPLAGLIGMIRTMQYDTNLTSMQVADLAMMERAAEELLTQVSGALDMQLIENGQLPYTPGTVNVGELICLLAKGFTAGERFRGVDLSLSVNGRPLASEDRVWARADSGLTMRLLSNLMTNAMEASGAGDTVQVRLENGSGVRVKVSNPAVVPQEMRSRFFEKSVSWGKTNGFGLGTYGAKLMAEFMNGSIDFTSNEADGTTVTVSLPGAVARA